MGRKKTIAIAVGVLILIGWIGGGLALHFGQIRHNHLDYDIDAHFPANQPFRPGEIFASTLAAIMDHELHSTFGWRPNDFFLWGPKVLADNNSDRQVGIIMAVRETTRIFKDHLTKVSSNEYDPNLVIADTDFRNDAERWILPAPSTLPIRAMGAFGKSPAGRSQRWQVPERQDSLGKGDLPRVPHSIPTEWRRIPRVTSISPIVSTIEF